MQIDLMCDRIYVPSAAVGESVSPAWDNGCLGYVGGRMDRHQDNPKCE